MSDKAKSKKAKKGTDKSTKKSGKSSKSASKAAKKAEREAKKAARKGDGTFPDVLVVTQEKNSEDGKKYFYGHSDDLGTLYKNGQTVAVYKLRRVSTIDIKRKVTR